MEALITNQSELRIGAFVLSLKPSAGLMQSDSYASMIPAPATTPRNVEPYYPTGMPPLLSRRPKSCRSGNRKPSLSRYRGAGDP
jgi:hypothetical protein